MKRIYIGGDSFCKYRYDADRDWPLHLANLLGYDSIEGAGHEGESWWHTRMELQHCLASSIAEEIGLFVFCHTDPHRILARNRMCQNLSNDIDHARQVYYKHIHDYHVHNWTTQNWYRELNSWMIGRPVIHLQGFETTKDYFTMLRGIKFSCPLTTSSLAEMPHDTSFFMHEHLAESQHYRRNHFSPAANLQLAAFIHHHYTLATQSDHTVTDSFLTHPV